jgi:hypothetical protein
MIYQALQNWPFRQAFIISGNSNATWKRSCQYDPWLGLTITAESPALKIFEPSSSLVLAGKTKMGPTPQVNPLVLAGDRNKALFIFPNPNCLLFESGSG